MANVKAFQKKVNGHGQGHMLKIYCNIEKALSLGTTMPNTVYVEIFAVY